MQDCTAGKLASVLNQIGSSTYYGHLLDELPYYLPRPRRELTRSRHQLFSDLKDITDCEEYRDFIEVDDIGAEKSDGEEVCCHTYPRGMGKGLDVSWDVTGQ